MDTSYNEPIDTAPTKRTLDQIQQKIVELKTQAQAVEDSIPEDYTELTEHVDFLTDENYEAKSGSDVFEIGRVLLSNGTINNTDENALKRIVTSDYVDWAVGFRVKDGYKAAVYVYAKNSSKTYRGAWSGSGFVKSGAENILWITGSYWLQGISTDSYFKISALRDDNADVTAEDFAGVEIFYGTKATKTELAEVKSILGSALDNVNDFALTEYSNGLCGKFSAALAVNNYTISGRGSASIALSGTPGLPITNATFAELAEEYFTIPLTQGMKYTFAFMLMGNAEEKNIAFYVAGKTDRTTINLGSYNYNTYSNKIVTREFTVPTTDLYAFKSYIQASEDKVVKVAIYPQDCAYQGIKALQESVATLTAKDTELESEIDALTAQMETAGKLESTGDSTDRTAEIRAKLNANGYCELGNGEFVVANLEMPAGTELRGQGYATVLKLDTSLTSGAAVIVNTNCTLKDMSIVGADAKITFTSESVAGNRHGIRRSYRRTYNVNISNVRVRYFDGYGLYDVNGGTPVQGKDDTQHGGMNVVNCFFDGCFACLYIQSGYNTFSNCQCDNGFYGVYTYAADNTFTNCAFEDCLTNAYVKNFGVTFVGCLFENMESARDGDALAVIDATMYPVKVVGCTFFYSGSIRVATTDSRITACMALFEGCEFYNMALPIVCTSGRGILFNGCMFYEDVTASGNIEETTAGAVKLKNCYRTTTGALLER